MGLERVSRVRDALALCPVSPLIAVGGTNGKGSTCAMLESIYRHAGYHVAKYTSPHLLDYNERIQIDGDKVDDATLCAAFAAIESARADVPLTYFEFGTLAAVWIFQQALVDIIILEVGMGGRLDAVNAFDADVAIVTSIDLDHMDFLGDSREAIGKEKAGIFRSCRPAICGDADPPISLLEYANEYQVPLQIFRKDFDVEIAARYWTYCEGTQRLQKLPMPALKGEFQLQNAACAVLATRLLHERLPTSWQDVCSGLERISLPGRFQKVSDFPEVRLDVAHNPHAALALLQNLQASDHRGRTFAVFSMLADKDIEGVVRVLADHIDLWFIAGIQHPRAANVAQLQALIAPSGSVHVAKNIAEAFSMACEQASKNDRIIAFGSFFTIAEILRDLNLQGT